MSIFGQKEDRGADGLLSGYKYSYPTVSTRATETVSRDRIGHFDDAFSRFDGGGCNEEAFLGGDQTDAAGGTYDEGCFYGRGSERGEGAG